MIRVVSLFALLALAGCLTTPAPPPSVPSPTQRPEPAQQVHAVSIGTIEGTPPGQGADKVAALFRAEIEDVAAARGIPFAATAGTLVFRGYLSVIGGGAGTILIYVFDVLDATGARLFTVNGSLNSAEVAADPWDAVAAETVAQAVAATFDQLQAWLANNGVGA